MGKVKAKVTWLGHASILVEAGRHRIFFDPWIAENPKCEMKLEDIKEATAICVTHGHNDHIGDSFQIVKQTGAKLICSPEIGFYAAKKGISYDEGSYPLNIGGSWRTEDFTVTMVNADHTSDILGEEFEADGTVIPGSGSSGYVLELRDGPCIYYTGDTGVFLDMAVIRELYAPDLAVCTSGGKYNMGYRETAYAAALISPTYLIPVHHGTFADQELDMEELRTAMRVRTPKVRLVTLAPGESFELD
jgi:L-ascorbate metabolism protein UlaG (beta-lactamase superfamily)